MCLIYNKKLTEQKLDFFKKHNIKEIIVWKVLYKNYHNVKYFSPYQSMEYKIGINSRTRVLKNIFKKDYGCEIIKNGALHVYSSRTKARSLHHNYINYKIIRCRVKVKDIIAYGTKRDIAVKALYIDKFSERK